MSRVFIQEKKQFEGRCDFCRKVLPRSKNKPFKFCQGIDGKSHCKYNFYYEKRKPYYQSYYRNKVVDIRGGFR